MTNPTDAQVEAVAYPRLSSEQLAELERRLVAAEKEVFEQSRRKVIERGPATIDLEFKAAEYIRRLIEDVKDYRAALAAAQAGATASYQRGFDQGGAIAADAWKEIGRKEGFAAGIEAAVRIADDHVQGPFGRYTHSNHIEEIAAAIRALRPSAPAGRRPNRR